MNKIFKLGVLLSMLTGYALSAFSQGQDASHQWNGNDVETVSTTTDADLHTVYLYNVGTKKFLNTGSYWGTVVVGFNVGMTVTITKDNAAMDAHRFIMAGPLATTEGNKIAFGRKMDTPDPTNIINYNHVYVDRGGTWNGHVNGVIHWAIEPVAGYGAGKHVYKIHCYNDEAGEMFGERYLYMENNASGKTNTIAYRGSVADTETNGLWMLVTRKDLKDEFKDAFASDEKPADATFLVYDQNFERANKFIDKWNVGGGITRKYNTNYTFNPSDANETFYVGNGATGSNYYMATYAGYTNANVRNIGVDAKANGKVYQSIPIVRRGWYRVSCNGFYNADKGSGMVSKFFARVQGVSDAVSNVSTPLEKFNKEFEYTKEGLTHTYDNNDLTPTPNTSPYVKAGLEFEKNKYKNVLLVYVPTDNKTLDIGVEIAGSTQDLDWTCWDNVQLEYCGNRDLVLSENETDIAYISKQVDPTTATTLILKRSLEVGKWNSVILPVNLTKGQLKSAFGEQVKLSELPHQSASISGRIDFTSVNLSGNENDVALKANQMYILYPTKAPVGDVISPYTKTFSDGTSVSVTTPYYIINNVVLKENPAALSNYANGILKDVHQISTTSDRTLQFCGSLINQTDKVVPKYSYVLGKDGKWGFTAKDYAVKGFRTWIATTSASSAGAAPYSVELSFYNDNVKLNDVSGIIGGDTATGIGQVLGVEGGAGEIYNLQGQRVGTGMSSASRLPKGIYIINHQKVVIK